MRHVFQVKQPLSLGSAAGHLPRPVNLNEQVFYVPRSVVDDLVSVVHASADILQVLHRGFAFDFASENDVGRRSSAKEKCGDKVMSEV